MAQAVGGAYGLPHGTLNGILLGPALAFNTDFACEAVRRFGEAIDAPDDPVARVEELSALAGPTRLSELGVPESDLPALAASAATRGGKAANPKPAKFLPEEIKELAFRFRVLSSARRTRESSRRGLLDPVIPRNRLRKRAAQVQELRAALVDFGPDGVLEPDELEAGVAHEPGDDFRRAQPVLEVERRVGPRPTRDPRSGGSCSATGFRRSTSSGPAGRCDS